MPGTFSQVLLHIVFSTKQRAAFITPDLQPRLYEYIGGIIRDEECALYAIGGTTDHVHLLLRCRTDAAIAQIVRKIRGGSSYWVHQTFPDMRSFAWQPGYSVFSVSKSSEPAVKKYIERQAEHHQRRDFKEELLAFLRAHGVEYDARYVFD